MTERPMIPLYAHRAVTDESLTDLLLGIEEEDVPVDISRHEADSPEELAHGAAVSSRLGVGLGIAAGTVVTTTEKLPAEHPYIKQSLGRDPESDRLIGSNAARLVKRTPLRGFTERNT